MSALYGGGLQPGVAPRGRHDRVERAASETATSLTDGPSERWHLKSYFVLVGGGGGGVG